MTCSPDYFRNIIEGMMDGDDINNAQVAYEIGTSPEMIRRWRSGREIPHWKMLPKISNWSGVALEHLIVARAKIYYNRIGHRGVYFHNPELSNIKTEEEELIRAVRRGHLGVALRLVISMCESGRAVGEDPKSDRASGHVGSSPTASTTKRVESSGSGVKPASD